MNIMTGITCSILIIFSNGVHSREQPVDLSRPFVCPDISPNTITLRDSRLNIDGITYQLTNGNASSLPSITNMIFDDSRGITEINILQNKKSGVLSMNFIKFKIPMSMIPVNMDPDHYKEYEIGTSDWGDMKKDNPYLRGDGLGCANR